MKTHPISQLLARRILHTQPVAIPLPRTTDDTPPPTVAELLAAATAAHLRYRRAVTDRTDDGQDDLRAAAVARAQAEVLDPTHADPAWERDGGTHAAGAMAHGEIHGDLLQFYARRLGLEA